VIGVYILDADHLGVLQRQTAREFGVLSQRLAQCQPHDVFTTIVSFHEQLLGWTAYLAKAKGQSQIVRGYERLEVLLSAFGRAQVLPFGPAAAEVFNGLRSSGLRIGTMDLRIASIAIASRMTVLTRNTVDFGKVPGLLFEDWTTVE
jgi:tRNA(fMet)-specific endonuclease VapC